MPSDLLAEIFKIRAALIQIECVISEADLRHRRELVKAINEVAALAIRISSIHCNCRRARSSVCSLTGIPLDPL